ncbi:MULTISPECIES: 4a-hydroxytetrahydrobiopterin dehydratase [unclassified Streptomyces]|uniref:Putative pterin-4-alpha-carbinolamine dehydratase n=1 Tax=Streptomyces johnsoniae TaxID=3075532 RepID=A0ABU2S2T7_9ACTN|nr:MULTISPECIES: 4a-hydroxytetrahydrobiopterin dehydratase [unclassified Streptomyces]MDT0442400.1 4a-hydroxytetrahydrobiopterin dehydratase [Streptomyces sp. DSM 41886]ONK10263.1 putative pterin-4-alpha-carbinolamine dehydratase [Streptomyces sp. MP131-18]
MAPRPLTGQEIEQALAGLPGWTLEDDRLVRSYGLAGHLPAVALLVHIATVQEELDHHADLALTYNRLGVAVHTHSVGGKVTELDVRLARRIEDLAPAHGAS